MCTVIKEKEGKATFLRVKGMDNGAKVATRVSFIYSILMIFTQCVVLRKMTLGKSHDK